MFWFLPPADRGMVVDAPYYFSRLRGGVEAPLEDVPVEMVALLMVDEVAPDGGRRLLLWMMILFLRGVAALW